MEPDSASAGPQHGYPQRLPGPPVFVPHTPGMPMFNPYQHPPMMQPTLPPQPYPPLPNSNFYSRPPGVFYPPAPPMYQGQMMYSGMQQLPPAAPHGPLPPSGMQQLPPAAPHGPLPPSGQTVFHRNAAPIHSQHMQTTPPPYPLSSPMAVTPTSPSVYGGQISSNPGPYPPQQTVSLDDGYYPQVSNQTQDTVFQMKAKQHAIKIETPPKSENIIPAVHTSMTSFPSLHETSLNSAERLIVDSNNKVPLIRAISQPSVNAVNISKIDDTSGNVNSGVSLEHSLLRDKAMCVETSGEQLRLEVDTKEENTGNTPNDPDRIVTVHAKDLDSDCRIAFDNVDDEYTYDDDDDISIEDHEFLTFDVVSSPFNICDGQSDSEATEELNDVEKFDGDDNCNVSQRLDGDFDEPDGGVFEMSVGQSGRKESVPGVSNIDVKSLSDCRKRVHEIEKEHADLLVNSEKKDFNNSENLTKFASVLVTEAIAKGMLRYLSTNQTKKETTYVLDLNKGNDEVDVNSNVTSKAVRRRSDGELKKRLYSDSWTYSLFDTDDLENGEIGQSDPNEEKGDYVHDVFTKDKSETMGRADSQTGAVVCRRPSSAPPSGSEVDEMEVENLKASIEDFEKFYFKQRAKVNNITIESPPKRTSGEKTGADSKKVIKQEEWVFPVETVVKDTMDEVDSVNDVSLQSNINSHNFGTSGSGTRSQGDSFAANVSNQRNDPVTESIRDDDGKDHFKERAKMNKILIEGPTVRVSTEMASHKRKDFEIGSVWNQNDHYEEKLKDIVYQLGNVVEESLQFNISSDQSSTSGRSASVWSNDDDGEQDLSGHSMLNMSSRRTSQESEVFVEAFKQKAMAQNILVQDPKETVEYTLGRPGSGRILRTGNVDMSSRTSLESEAACTSLNPTCPEFKSSLRRSSSEGRSTSLNPVSPEFKPGFKKMVDLTSNENGLDSKMKLRVDAPVFSPGSLNTSTRSDTSDQQDFSMRTDAPEFYPVGSNSSIVTGSSLLTRPTTTKTQTKLSLEAGSGSSSTGAKPVICFIREPPVKKGNPSVGLQVSPEICDSCVGTRRRRTVESSTLTANCDSRDVMINTDESIFKEKSMYHVVPKPTKKMVCKSMNTDEVRKRSVGVMVREPRTVLRNVETLELENKVRCLSETVRTLQLEVRKYKQREIDMQEKLKAALHQDLLHDTGMLGDGDVVMQVHADMQQIQALAQRTVAQINSGRIYSKLPDLQTGVPSDSVSSAPIYQDHQTGVPSDSVSSAPISQTGVPSDSVSSTPISQTSSMVTSRLNPSTVVGMTDTDSNLVTDVNSYTTTAVSTNGVDHDRILDVNAYASTMVGPTAVEADGTMGSPQYAKQGPESVPQFQSTVVFPSIDMNCLKTSVATGDLSTGAVGQLMPSETYSVNHVRSPSKITSSKHSPRLQSLPLPTSVSKSRSSPQRTVEGENMPPEGISVAEIVRELEHLKCDQVNKQSSTSPNAMSLLDIEDIDDATDELIGVADNVCVTDVDACVTGVDLEEFKSVGDDMRKLISDKMFAEYSQPVVDGNDDNNDNHDDGDDAEGNDLSELDWDDENRTDLYSETDRQETPVEAIDSEGNDKLVSKTDTMVVTDADGNVEVIEQYTGEIDTVEVHSELATEEVQPEQADGHVENGESDTEEKDTDTYDNDERTNEVSQLGIDEVSNEAPSEIENTVDRIDSISSENEEPDSMLSDSCSISSTKEASQQATVMQMSPKQESITSNDPSKQESITSNDPSKQESITSNDPSMTLPMESAAEFSSSISAGHSPASVVNSSPIPVNPSPEVPMRSPMIMSPLSSFGPSPIPVSPSPAVPMSSPMVISPLPSLGVSPATVSLSSPMATSPLSTSVVTSPAAMPMGPSMLTSQLSMPSLGNSASMSMMISGLDPALYQAVFAQLLQSYPQLVGNQEMLTGIAIQQTQLLQFYMSTGQTPEMPVGAGVGSMSTSVSTNGIRNGGSLVGNGNMVGVDNTGMTGNMGNGMNSDDMRKLDSAVNNAEAEKCNSGVLNNTSERAKLAQAHGNAATISIPSHSDIGTSEVGPEFKHSQNSCEKGKDIVESKPAPKAGIPPGLKQPPSSNYFASSVEKAAPRSLFQDNGASMDSAEKHPSHRLSRENADTHDSEGLYPFRPPFGSIRDTPAPDRGMSQTNNAGKLHDICATKPNVPGTSAQNWDESDRRRRNSSVSSNGSDGVVTHSHSMFTSKSTEFRGTPKSVAHNPPDFLPAFARKLSPEFTGSSDKHFSYSKKNNLPPRLRRANSNEGQPPPSHHRAPPVQPASYQVPNTESEDWDSEVDPYPQQFQLRPNNNWHINMGGDRKETTVGRIGKRETTMAEGKRGISMAGDSRGATVAGSSRKVVNMTGDAKSDAVKVDFKKRGNDGGVGMMDISEISLQKNAPKLPDNTEEEKENKEEVDDEWCTVQKNKKKRTVVRESTHKELKNYSAPLVNSAQVGPQKPPNMSSFERLVARLQQEFPHVDRENLITAIMKIRDIRGSLSGLSVDDIIQKAQAYISTSKSKVPWRPVGSSRKPPVPQAPPAGYVQNDAATEEEICVICHDRLTSEPIKTLDCSHVYHTRCISEWVRRERTCPTCRTHALFPEEFPRLGK